MKPHTLWKHPRPYSYQWHFWVSLAGSYRHGWEGFNGISQWPFFDPVTLTYELDPDILPLDHYAKIQVCISVLSIVRVRRTDTQIERRCQNYYPRHVRDVGCNKNSTLWSVPHLIDSILKDTWYTCSQILVKFVNTQRIKNLNDTFLTMGP